MDEAPGLGEQYRTASPWPVFIALGLPIAELGILFDVFPVAVGGLLLLTGSVAGILDEAGYANSIWRALAALAVFLVALGGVFLVVDGYVAADAVKLGMRGWAVVAAGVIQFAAAVVGQVFSLDQPYPS